MDISQRHPGPDNQRTGAVTRTGHAQVGNTHRQGSHRHGRPNPSRLAENDKEDHLHNMHERLSAMIRRAVGSG